MRKTTILLIAIALASCSAFPPLVVDITGEWVRQDRDAGHTVFDFRDDGTFGAASFNFDETVATMIASGQYTMAADRITLRYVRDATEEISETWIVYITPDAEQMIWVVQGVSWWDGDILYRR